MKNSILFTLLLFINISFSQGVVDGFFKGKRNCDIALTGAYQHSDIFFRGSDKIDYARDLAIVSLFAEYGITNHFDVIGSIPFINGNLQDMSIFAKYDLIGSFSEKEIPFKIIPALGFSFPMSKYNTQTTNAIGQRATIIQPKLVLQQNLYPFFIQAQGGYNYALTPVTSSYIFSSKIGWSKNRIYTDLWFEHQEAIGGLDWTSNSIDFRELGVSYNRIGGVLYYTLKDSEKGLDWGTFINYSYILNGRNIGQAYTVGIGLVCSIKQKKN